MPEFYLVRHGEESFASEHHDHLGLQGCEQAIKLGGYLRRKQIDFDRVVTGSMIKHQQCAQKICQGLQVDLPIEQHAGLNDYDFQSLVQVYLKMHPGEIPKDGDGRQAFFNVLKQALLLWSQNKLAGEIPESWQEFQQRVKAAIGDICSHHTSERTLVVTSGGPIAMTISNVFKISNEQVIELDFKIENTSFSQFDYQGSQINLTRFKCTSHLSTGNSRPINEKLNQV